MRIKHLATMDTIRFQCRLALRAFAVTCAALVCVSSVRLNAATASLVGWSAQGVNETAGTDFSDELVVAVRYEGREQK